jgi:hypothetical protein
MLIRRIEEQAVALAEKTAELKSKDAILNDLMANVASFSAELKNKDAELKNKDAELKNKDTQSSKAHENNFKVTLRVEPHDIASDSLKKSLESRFDDKMSWDNHGTYWNTEIRYTTQKPKKRRKSNKDNKVPRRRKGTGKSKSRGKAKEKLTAGGKTEAKIEAKPKSRKQIYESYIRSNQWKEKCEETYLLFGRTCEVCQEEGKKTCIHHNNYHFLKEERPHLDLIVMCQGCHWYFHKRVPGSKLQGHRNEENIDATCTLCARPSRYSRKTAKRVIHFCKSCFLSFKFKLDAGKVKKFL